MNVNRLIHELSGKAIDKPGYELKVRVLTRDEEGKIVRQRAAPIRLVSGTGDLVVEESTFVEEKP